MSLQADAGQREKIASNNNLKSYIKNEKSNINKSVDLTDNNVLIHQSIENKNNNKLNKRNFRDERYYMSYGDEDVVQCYAEESMQPQYGLKTNELLNAHGIEKALLDVTPEEALEMNKKRRMMRWDARKRKFVKQSLEEMSLSKGAKRVRTESGSSITKSLIPQGELYKKWRKKSHREVNTGPTEGDIDDSPRPHVKINKNIPDELRSVQEIRKIHLNKDNMKLKNMSKEQRAKLLKGKPSWKQRKEKAIRNTPQPNSRSKAIFRR
mmetsp:Transcript_12626/g.12702  ORF Transcript_12626/g.12702 Transcript_12626/m.12702 type:complete len:266 (+) Transcript_12626:3-800(+)